MEVKEYLEMTYDEIAGLDREKTLFACSISPTETHGPHLPMGTDLFIADNIRDRVIEKLKETHPSFTVVLLPRLNFGAEAIPVAGSILVRYRAILYCVLDTGLSLADQGFKYWLLTDNHGGPRHQMAIEMASRKLEKKGLSLIAPFNEAFRRMVGHCADLLEKTGLTEATCGGVEDSHAGENETSLMLAACPEKVRDCWKTTGEARTSPMTFLPGLLGGISKVLKAVGAKDAALDFYFMSHGLAWVSDPNMDPYQGTPSNATVAAGEQMLAYRASLAHELLTKAINGEKVRLNPLGWSARAMKDVM